MARPSGYLKENSKRILDVIAGQDAKNATQAYLSVHPDAAPITAATNAYKLLQKPAAQIYLQEHIDNAKNTVVELMNTAKKEEIRLSAAKDILDRETGKAIQRVEQHTTGVTLTIDLTSSIADTPTS